MDALRSIAVGALRRERTGHTLQPTALVHEAYLRISRQRSFEDLGRQQFLMLGARMIRRVLVDHARRRGRAKRQGDSIPRSPEELESGLDAVELLAIHEVLERLGEIDARQAQVVELRFFGGLDNGEIAEMIGVSRRTVVEDWRLARAWLMHALEAS